MSDVEILLQVDAGQTPPGTTAVFIDEEDSLGRWVGFALSLGAISGAVACAWAGVHPAAITLLLLAGGLFGIQATPTLPTGDERPIKRQVAVMTPTAIILRDDQGLHTWQLTDLERVVAESYNRQYLLMLIDRSGHEYALQPIHFRRGERLRALIDQRLRALRVRSL